MSQIIENRCVKCHKQNENLIVDGILTDKCGYCSIPFWHGRVLNVKKTYIGFFNFIDNHPGVKVNEKYLNPRLDLMNHSPNGFTNEKANEWTELYSGFQWGYGGSGPAQLALAILADFLRDDQEALQYYQNFKWNIIAQLPINTEFELSGQKIYDWLLKQPL